MATLLLAWTPFLIGLFIVTRKIQRKRIAIPLLIGCYFLTLLIAVIIGAIPIYTAMVETGTGDPQLMAGAISENIVSRLLLSFIELPILFLIFFGLRKWRQGRS